MELDGRDVVVKGYENGNFVGPTILSGVKVSNHIHFGLKLLTSFSMIYSQEAQFK